MGHLQIEKGTEEEPFTPEGFEKLRQAYGDDVAWDTLYALGMGQEDWQEIYPSITNKILMEAVEKEAARRGVTEAKLSGGEVQTKVKPPKQVKRAPEPAAKTTPNQEDGDASTVRGNFLSSTYG